MRKRVRPLLGGEKMPTHCGTDRGHKPKLMPLKGGEAHRKFDLYIATKLRLKFFLRARHQGKPTANESSTNMRNKRAVIDKYREAWCFLVVDFPARRCKQICMRDPFWPSQNLDRADPFDNSSENIRVFKSALSFGSCRKLTLTVLAVRDNL